MKGEKKIFYGPPKPGPIRVREGGCLLEVSVVRTDYVKQRKHYVRQAMRKLGRPLTFDEINRCERRAAIGAALEWEPLHQAIDDDGKRKFVKTILKLGGTIEKS